MKKLFLLITVCSVLCGCGRKWEQLWGQDTRPEIRYIPLTTDSLDIPVGTINPIQYASPSRIQNSKFLSVWACNDADTCIAIPEHQASGDPIVVYVQINGFLLNIYNVQSVYPWATKIRIQYVL